MKKTIRRLCSLALSAVMLCAAPNGFTALAAQTDSESVAAGVTTVNVTASDISSMGATSAIQRALSAAADNASDSNFYRVVVAKGTYTLGSALCIYSNTCLSLNGVTLKRGSANMLVAGGKSWEDEVGYCYRNITIEGGTFDGQGMEGTMMKLAHARNVLLKKVAVKNNKNSHMMEVAGIDGFTVSGCTFTDQISATKDGYEAIQLDVMKSGNFDGYRYEDLPMTNVLVENCTFTNCPRGVGSHTAILNNPHKNITIRGNTFKNMASVAVEGLNWVSCNITGNTIDTAPRAIALFTASSGTYTSASIAAQGGTQTHAADEKPAYWTNGNIENNVIKNCGTIDDKYNPGRERSAISVMGETISGGGLPSGEYTMINVAVKHNVIQTRGNGIRVEYARNIVLEGNEISHGAKVNSNDYGVVLRKNTTNTYINKNYLKNVPVNAIQVDTGCKVKQIVSNEIYTTGKYGMAAYGSTVDLVKNNEVRDTAQEGIFAHDGAVINSVTENRLMRTGDDAIYATSTATIKSIERNTAYQCAGAPGGNNYTSAASLSSFTLADSSVSLQPGGCYRVSKTVSPVNALYDFTFKSSNTAVATADAAGLVRALMPGTANITVSATNGMSRTLKVTVASSTPSVLSGDVDKDGFVTGADYAALSGYLARWQGCGSVNAQEADVSSDGTVDVKDRIVLARHLNRVSGYETLPKRITDAESGSGSLSVGSAVANPGETAEVTISLTANSGIANLTFAVEYDEAALTLESVTEHGLMKKTDVQHSNKPGSPYQLTWINDVSTSNITAKGELLTLTFRVKEGASGSSAVSVQPGSIQAYDGSIKRVPFTASPGSVQINQKLTVSGTFSGVEPNADVLAELYREGETEAAYITYNDNGGYLFEDVEPGVYTLVVIPSGGAFLPAVKTVTVADEPVREDIVFRVIGDVDNDGDFDIDDATMIQRHLAEFTNPDGSPIIDETNDIELRAADIDFDLRITIYDVTTIQRMLAGIC